MTPTELLEWWKIRKKILGYTNEIIAERSLIPVGTINRVFSGKNPEFRYDTAQSITKALLPNENQGNECEELYTEKINQLEKENAELKEVIINTKKSTTQKRNGYLMAAAYFAPWVLFFAVWISSK
jgi:hypothetical protein